MDRLLTVRICDEEAVPAYLRQSSLALLCRAVKRARLRSQAVILACHGAEHNTVDAESDLLMQPDRTGWWVGEVRRKAALVGEVRAFGHEKGTGPFRVCRRYTLDGDAGREIVHSEGWFRSRDWDSRAARTSSSISSPRRLRMSSSRFSVARM